MRTDDNSVTFPKENKIYINAAKGLLLLRRPENNSVSRSGWRLPGSGNYIAAILHSVFPGSLFMQTTGIYDEKMYVYVNRVHKRLLMFQTES